MGERFEFLREVEAGSPLGVFQWAQRLIDALNKLRRVWELAEFDLTGQAGNVVAVRLDENGFELSSGGSSNLTNQWKFDNATASADPGSGELRLDAATYAGTTNIYISQISNSGVDVAVVLAAMVSGDRLYIQDLNDSTKWARFSISGALTDNGTWWTIPVTHVSSAGGLFANNQVLSVTVLF